MPTSSMSSTGEFHPLIESISVDKLSRQTPTISLILLTHPTIAHLGAYAHCCKHIPLFSRIPVYATTPVISLGRTFTQDLYASTPLASSSLPTSALAELSQISAARSSESNTHILLPRPSDDEIASYFSLIHPLKYSQEHQPVGSTNGPPLEGLTITAYPAGHTVGGTIWHIRHGSELVVYAVDWNQARENVMSGAGWLGGGSTSGSEVIEQLHQPTALICSAKQSQSIGVSGGWRHRDEQLLAHIREAVQRSASVLIPCDTSGRVLELSYMLERAWTENEDLRHAKLHFASHTADATMKYARSMLEWMDDNVVKEFETQAGNTARGGSGKGSQPFDFKHMKLLERTSQLERALGTSGPKVFLASGDNLDWGFSRDIVESLCSDASNLIVLPSKPKDISQAKEGEEFRLSVYSKLSAKLTEENTVTQLDEDLNWRDSRITALGMDELAVYQQYLARQRQRLDANSIGGSTALETSADAAEDRSSSSSSSEDSDDEHQGRALNTASTMQHSKRKLGITDEELGINILLRRKDHHDFDVRGRKGRERVFPFVMKRKRNDEFGDLIRPEEYLRAEERDDVDGQAPEDPKKANARIGQKRRLDGREAGRVEHGRSGSYGNSNKRRKSDTGPNRQGQRKDAEDDVGKHDSDVESEESDYEPAEPIVLGPQKITFTHRSLHVKTKIVAIDFAGIHDKRSLQMLLPLIKPRRLILTAGNEEETALMSTDCEKLLGGSSKKQDDSSRGTTIHAPGNNETVDASVDTNAWSIRLSRSLLKGLNWQKYRSLGVVTIDGQIQELTPEDEDQVSATKRVKLETPVEGTEKSADSEQSKTLTVPILNSLPPGIAAMTRSFIQSNHVGDLRLAELRKLLQDRGHVAQFKGEGTLLVDDHIAVRKNGIGKIEVESGGGFAAIGSFGTGLHTVKQKIYEGLATVAAR